MNNHMQPQIPGGIIEIEISAEKLYYTIIGNQNEMKLLLNNINKKNNDNREYFISKLMIPLAYVAENESLKRNINIELAQGIEQVQCSVLCECKSHEEKDAYILLCIDFEHYNSNYKQTLLKFPEIELRENIEPEKTIISDIKKLLLDMPKPIKDTLRLIDITGPDEDILVYCARMSNPTNKQTKFTKKLF